MFLLFSLSIRLPWVPWIQPSQWRVGKCSLSAVSNKTDKACLVSNSQTASFPEQEKFLSRRKLFGITTHDKVIMKYYILWILKIHVEIHLARDIYFSKCVLENHCTLFKKNTLSNVTVLVWPIWQQPQGPAHLVFTWFRCSLLTSISHCFIILRRPVPIIPSTSDRMLILHFQGHMLNW